MCGGSRWYELVVLSAQFDQPAVGTELQFWIRGVSSNDLYQFVGIVEVVVGC